MIPSTADADGSPYPEREGERTRWILARRGPRNLLDPRRPRSAALEAERTEAGDVAPVLAVFLVNRECPWRCLMCDLWIDTLERRAPQGAVAEQVVHALTAHPSVRRVKLYNAGNFFDPGAVSEVDRAAIAARVAPLDRVVVESHPTLVGGACFDFAKRLRAGALEVAMGLETSHPEVLPKLNKRMTAEGFASAAGRLIGGGIAVRGFVLVGLPFLSAGESLDWARRSVDFAFDSGCEVVSLIPTRAGNGAMDALARAGQFRPPNLAMLESAAEHAVRLARGRAFADLWDLERLAGCASCFPARRARLERMNRLQIVPPRVVCDLCGEGA